MKNPVSATPVGPTLPFLSGSGSQLSRLLSRSGLGFSPEEIGRIREYFVREGRDPTRVELAGLAQSWSEHCSYKSSKVFLKRHFGGLPGNLRALAMGDAGVMAIDDRWAYALRIESHNHPSAIEPYGGAATGIGGILRDVLAMGAKPVALADPLFFGPLEWKRGDLPHGVKHPRYLFRHVVSGIADYGNRVGVPTVAGLITFDEAYLVNPLVNVGCVGVVRRDKITPNRATAIGQKLVLAGGLTGRDGIGGVSFASRELTGRSEKVSRPAVQLGNPIMKEPLIHAVLESVEAGLISGVKDLGGGGLASASGELVHAGAFGSEIHLDRVPLRETGLLPWEIWISESQERMLMAVEEDNVERLLTIFRMHDVPVSVIGEVGPAPLERIYWKGDLVASLRLPFRIDPPLLERPHTLRHRDTRGMATPPEGTWEDLLTRLVLSGDGASREAVIRLYDHEVQGRTVGKPLVGDPRNPTHADAAVLRVLPDMETGLAVAVGSAPFVGAIHPERGGSLAVVEAARNLYSVGARPDALTNCLNFGNPENPEVLGDFDASVRGLARAATDLGMAVPSGNVSFYNGGLGSGIPPTPVVMAVGLHPDVLHPLTPYLKDPGNLLFVLGATHPALGGSLYDRMHGRRDTAVPPYDGEAVRGMGDALLPLMKRGVVTSCHDVSEGGLGVALLEMAFGSSLGLEAEVPAPGGMPAWRALVTEGGSRWVLEVKKGAQQDLVHALGEFPLYRIGRVTDGDVVLKVDRRVKARMDPHDLYPRWRSLLAGGEAP